jgi:hypothetical protein
MRTIRKTWYENNLIDQCHKAGWDKQLAITLHAYLDSQNYEIFCQLFPEYSTEMGVYHKYITDVVTAMAQKTLTPTAEDPTHKNVVALLLQSFKDNVRLEKITQGLFLGSCSLIPNPVMISSFSPFKNGLPLFFDTRSPMTKFVSMLIQM